MVYLSKSALFYIESVQHISIKSRGYLAFFEFNLYLRSFFALLDISVSFRRKFNTNIVKVSIQIF